MSNFKGYSSSLNKHGFSSIRKFKEEQEIILSDQKSKKIQQNDLASKERAIILGNMIKFVKDGDKVLKFYYSFEYDANVFELGDFVLVRPTTTRGKPFIRIIKAIASDSLNRIMVTTQWFYRPEETKNKEGECYKAHDKRELFYSFRHEDILAESILHECVVHFIPSHKQLPLRTLHPGFIVRRVYDFVENKLHDLTDSDFDEKKQQEIDILVKRTQEHIGDSTNDAVVKTTVNKMDSFKRKRTNLYRAEPTTEINKLSEAYAGCAINVSKYHMFLAEYHVLTGNTVRDKWLEKLLQSLEKLCSSTYKNMNNFWLEVIPIIAKLERVAYEALGNDLKKYNQKIRQLDYNLQKSEYLVQRLLKRELEPISLLTMTPEELKKGLTADEMMIFEPEMNEQQMQMTDVRCIICGEKQVGIRDVINAVGRGDRYQLECCECGHAWFSFRDAIALSLLPDSNHKS